MKSKILITSILALGVASCGTVKDGTYLGGMVEVSGFSKPEKNGSSEPQVEESHSEVKSVAKKQQVNDLSAQANAQGVCWIGCTSKEPSPMEKAEFSISGVDVDTAYARVKREFDFKTRAERVEADPAVAGWLENTLDFRYQATPGVNYLMRGYEEHKYNNEESPNTIQVEVFKDGPNQVYIKFSFYSGNTKDLEGYKASLKDRIIKAVKG